MSRDPVISAARHSLEEIRQAAGASMLLFSPIFEKVTEQGTTRGQGLAALRAAVDFARPTPVLALGGITGDVSLYPQPKGWIKTSVSGFDLAELQGEAKQAGVTVVAGVP